MEEQSVLFDQRFLGKHAGAIISDPGVALVELVANAWDSYATDVVISWPNPKTKTCFSIRDNGWGMAPEEFERRWITLDYDRLGEQGRDASPPPELAGEKPRPTFGRNGRGRYAAFKFSSPYEIRTWRDGVEVTYRVLRSTSAPLELKQVRRRTRGIVGHGTEIRGLKSDSVGLTAEAAREILGARFLTDPRFKVSIDGTQVGFDDIPKNMLLESSADVPNLGTAKILMIDAWRSDRTTMQHGIAWRVSGRLVGECTWQGFFDERILDGRTAEAKRFTFIVFADFLSDSIAPDWSEFKKDSEAWQATRPIVQERIGELLTQIADTRRSEVKDSVKERLGAKVSNLPPIGRARWTAFVDKVIDNCPTLTEGEVEQIATILANLEQSSSKYGLITKLHELKSGQLDDLHQLLDDWSLTAAKAALDELQSRLKLIRELDVKLRDENADEVKDLQPLFETSLWVFGPQFESIEYTSNKGMTTIIRNLLGAEAQGSLQRPDFVIIPDGSVGLYSRDSYGEDFEVEGVESLVIAEIKKPGVTIGTKQIDQALGYATELMKRGSITSHTPVACFVLGSKLQPFEAEETKRGRVTITPMAYDTFIRRAEKRMLGLREKLKDAPFLHRHGLDAEEFLNPPQPRQAEFWSVN